MGVTLDAGALIVYQQCFQQPIHPLSKRVAAWTRDSVVVSTPSLAWAEFWRGRGSNDHFIAKIKERIRVESVTQKTAEYAADALRKAQSSTNRNSVKHLIDAIVMSHANEMCDAVYTNDIGDFEQLWNCFPHVKSLVNANTGQIVLKR